MSSTRTRACLCLVIGPLDEDQAQNELDKQAALLQKWMATDRFCVGLRRWRDGASVWLYEYL